MKPILILWTCKDLSEAKRIARLLLTQKRIACASLIPAVESLFVWEGKLEEATECKVFFKTMASQFEAVKEVILTHGSYQTPEILQLNIEEANPAYIDWMREVLVK